MKKVFIVLFTIIVMSVGLSGCQEQTAIEQENISPFATCSANKYSGYNPMTVSFQGSGIDNDGEIISYFWDFGDGSNSTEQNPTHIYNEIGAYNISFTVTDDEGAIDTGTIQISVKEKPNNPPTASISADDETGIYKSQTVHFTGSGTDTDGNIVSYKWYFGDGSSSNEQNPTHTFYHDGEDYICSYKVTLIVTDNKGATDTDYEYISLIGLIMTVTDYHFNYYLNRMYYDITVETCFDVEISGCYRLKTSRVGEEYETCTVTSNIPDTITAGSSASWSVIFHTTEEIAGRILIWERIFGDIETYVY